MRLATLSFFFDKEYILISRRYQFDPACPSGNTDAHNQKKKKKYKKKKVPVE
jgi:hypothetical protein